MKVFILISILALSSIAGATVAPCRGGIMGVASQNIGTMYNDLTGVQCELDKTLHLHFNLVAGQGKGMYSSFVSYSRPVLENAANPIWRYTDVVYLDFFDSKNAYLFSIKYSK